MARAKTGILTSASNTIQSGFGMAEQGAGLGVDTLITARKAMEVATEYLKPSMMDAKIETMTTFAEGMKSLMDLGVDEAEARAYLGIAL